MDGQNLSRGSATLFIIAVEIRRQEIRDDNTNQIIKRALAGRIRIQQLKGRATLFGLIKKIAGYRGLRAAAFGLPWRAASEARL